MELMQTACGPLWIFSLFHIDGLVQKRLNFRVLAME